MSSSRADKDRRAEPAAVPAGDYAAHNTASDAARPAGADDKPDRPAGRSGLTDGLQGAKGATA